MTIASTPCEKHYITVHPKSGLSLRPLNLLLKSILKKKPKTQITTFHALHQLPAHLKSDVGLWDIRPPIK
ncbi:MAG: hypothetical protein V7776_18665 [Halopseudomonas aestusnigri]